MHDICSGLVFKDIEEGIIRKGWQSCCASYSPPVSFCFCPFNSSISQKGNLCYSSHYPYVQLIKPMICKT